MESLFCRRDLHGSVVVDQADRHRIREQMVRMGLALHSSGLFLPLPPPGSLLHSVPSTHCARVCPDLHWMAFSPVRATAASDTGTGLLARSHGHVTVTVTFSVKNERFSDTVAFFESE